MAPRWNFIKIPKGGVPPNVSDDNYFRDDSTDLVASLVRENIQNALDAQSGAAPVIVRFSINKVPKKHIKLVKHLLADGDDSVLKHYLQVCAEDEEIKPENPDFEHPSFMLIEDFNTDGLDGDIRSPDLGGFAVFWRNSGVTNKLKGKNRGGSFGIGKIVNPMSSRLQTFFGLTIRNVANTKDSDAGPMLMGQTLLRMHTLNGTRFPPYALFGELEDEMELPIREYGFLREFVEAAGITRTNEPGLSLAIPFPFDDFTAPAITAAAIRHYFYPIVEKRLIVEIINAQGKSVISEENIQELAKTLGDDVEELIAFTRQSQDRLGHSSDLTAEVYSIGRYGTTLTAEMFDAADFVQHKNRFQEGHLVTVDVPIQTEAIATKEKKQSSVRLFLKKTEGRGMDYYIRKGISLHDNSCFSSSTPCIGLLVSDEGEIAELLRKAEGPAHTHWVMRNCKAAKIYTNATKVIGYVKTLLDRMQNLLGGGVEREDESFLADDFPDISSIEVDSAPVPVEVHLSKDGTLSVSSTPNSKDHTGKPCTITIWFESAARGKKWSILDFDLANMSVATQGVQLDSCLGNTIKFKFKDDFSIKVEGFDPKKDLTTSVKFDEKDTSS